MKIPSFYQALLYPLDQKGWWKELLITIAIAAIPVVGFFMVQGWEFETSSRLRHKAPRAFPGWGHLPNRFVRGFLIRLAAFLYNIPTWIAALITLWLWLGPIVEAMQGKVALNTPVNQLYGPGLPLRISMIFITMVLWFVCNSLFWSGYLRYIDTRRYILFFDLGTNIVVTVTTMWDDIFISIYHVGAQAIAAALDAALSALLAATGVGAFLIPILVPAVNFTFMSMFKAYLFGEMAESAFGEEEAQIVPMPGKPFYHPATDPRLRAVDRQEARSSRTVGRDRH